MSLIRPDSRPIATARRACFGARILQEPLLAQRGSIGTSARWLKPTLFSYGSSFSSAPSSFELFDGHLARFETIQAAQSPRPAKSFIVAVGIHDVHDRQFVALADLKVGLVVRGRHLQHAGAEFEIDMLVADDRDELLFVRQFGRQRTHDVLADEIARNAGPSDSPRRRCRRGSFPGRVVAMVSELCRGCFGRLRL